MFNWGTAKLFSKWMHNFTFPPAVCVGSDCSPSSPVFFIIVILLDIIGYLPAILICISLITNHVGHFSHTYWPFASLFFFFFWRNVYSHLLPALNWVVFHILELSVYVFLDTSHYQIYDLKVVYVLPACELSFCFRVIWRTSS